MSRAADLFAAARAVLDCGDIQRKPALSRQFAQAFREGALAIPDDAPAPSAECACARPARPPLVHPRELPRRGLGSDEGRAAFLHAVAHIEFNAIDLAWDAVWRFRGMPRDYYADWVQVGDDEARHFAMLRARLADFGRDYGDFPAHDGLWEMARKTAHDGLARMALVPRVLEARGLDVTPGMIEKLESLGDERTAAILRVILAEEIAHVAAGTRWYRWFCMQRGLPTHDTFRALLQQYASGVLHGPFNLDARRAAGFDEVELGALCDPQAAEAGG